MVVSFTCLIPYSLISLENPLEKHVDVLCNALKHSSLLPSAEDRLCVLTGTGAGTRGGHSPDSSREKWQSWVMTWVELLTPVVPWEIAYLWTPVFLE